MRKFFATLALAAALAAPLTAVAPPSETFAQNVAANNLVNVQVGDVTILRNVNVAAAVQAVANVCPGVDLNVAALTTLLAQGGGSTTINCAAAGAPITITQVRPGRRP